MYIIYVFKTKSHFKIMITFAQPLKTPTIQNLFDIITHLSPDEIQSLVELFGPPCQATIDFRQFLTDINSF